MESSVAPCSSRSFFCEEITPSRSTIVFCEASSSFFRSANSFATTSAFSEALRSRAISACSFSISDTSPDVQLWTHYFVFLLKYFAKILNFLLPP